MDAESKIRILISSVLNGKGFDDATTATNKLKKSTNSLSINAPFKALKNGADSLVSPFRMAGGAIAALGIGVAIKEGLKLADTYSLVNSRLKLVSASTVDLAINEQEVYKIAQRSRQGYKDTADLYYSIARSTENLGKTQTETLGVTETINKSLVISGASAESSKAALIQLGQGFASGTLRGEELNSVLEQAPRLAEAIAKGMGVTVGELRALGEQGKLTGDAVFNALQNQADAVNKEFAKITPIVEQAMTNASNSTLKFVGTLDRLTGTSAAVSTAISSISSKVDQYSDSIRVASSSVFEQKTVDDITIKANQIADEIAGLKTALKNDDGWLWFGLDDRTTSEYENKIKRLEQQMEQLGDTAVSVLWKTKDATKTAVLSGEKVKEQTDEALKAYSKYYETVGDYATAWAIKERELVAGNSTLNDDQLKKMIAASKKAYFDKEMKSSVTEAKKLQEDYYDYIADLSKSSTENKVDQEVLQEAYKYQKFLDEHKLNLEQKTALERAFMGAIERIQLDGQKESLKKQQDALLEYYKSVGNTTAAAEIELAKYKESINDLSLGDMQKKEMIATMEKDLEREKLLKQLDFNEEYYKAVGDMANANAIAQEKYALQLEKQGYSKDKISNMAYGSQSQKSNYDTMYSSVGIDTGLAGQMQDRLKSIDTFQETERSRIEAHYALLEQNNTNHQAKMAEIDEMQFSSRLATASTGFSSLSSIAKMFYDASDGQNKVALRTYQAFSVAQAMINTYTAASKALATGGPYMGPAMAAIAVAQGMAQVAMIKAQKFHSGGFVTGTTDEVPAILQREEGVLSRKGMKNLDALNLGTASSSSSGSQQITIVNSIDPAIMEQYVTSRSGRKVIKNIMNGS